MKLISGLLLFVCFSVSAQNDSLFMACSSRNYIIYPEHLSHFSPFSANRDSVSGAPKSIIQIGDSHVQISHFPLAFAATLDSAYTSITEKSFWFPYAMLGGYTPKGFTISCKDATAEKMVTATHEKRFTITGHAMKVPEGDHRLFISCVKKDFREIEMIAEKNVSWKIDSDKAIVNRRPISENLELITISSVSENDSLELKLSVGNLHAEPLRIYGFREKTPRTNLEFEFYGSSGSKFSDYVQNANFLGDYISEKKPKLFIISLGTNDSYLVQQPFIFRRRIKKLLKTVRQNSAAAVLFTLPPNTCYKGEKPRSEMKVRKAIFKIASKQKCALWDFYTVMGGDGSMKKWRALGLTSADLLHLNKTGYELQGRLLAEVLSRFELYKVVQR